jgi:hypothetical protein
MPPYSFKFIHNVNDIVYDTTTKQNVKIVGVSYMNGKTLELEQIFFHNVVCLIEFDNGVRDARFDDELEVI